MRQVPSDAMGRPRAELPTSSSEQFRPRDDSATNHAQPPTAGAGAVASAAVLVLAIALTLFPPVPGGVARGFDYAGDPFARGHHRGVDLATRPGEPVRAACGGRVTFAGRAGANGRAVTVRCGPWSVTHLPLRELAVHAGDRVPPRAILGAHRHIEGPRGHPPRRPPRRRPAGLRRPRTAAPHSARPRATGRAPRQRPEARPTTAPPSAVAVRPAAACRAVAARGAAAVAVRPAAARRAAPWFESPRPLARLGRAGARARGSLRRGRRARAPGPPARRSHARPRRLYGEPMSVLGGDLQHDPDGDPRDRRQRRAPLGRRSRAARRRRPRRRGPDRLRRPARLAHRELVAALYVPTAARCATRISAVGILDDVLGSVGFDYFDGPKVLGRRARKLVENGDGAAATVAGIAGSPARRSAITGPSRTTSSTPTRSTSAPPPHRSARACASGSMSA